MPFNLYHKTLDVITQWLETTVTVINPLQQPVKIRIREEENFRQYGGQRKISTLKDKY